MDVQSGKRERNIEISDLDLYIVPETLEDAENIYRYMGCDPEITRYTGWNPYRTLQATVDKIEKDINSDDGSYSWVIKKDGDFVGTIGAYDYNAEDMSIEIGYSIARPFWGKGYAGAATKAVVAFLLDNERINTIRAWSHKDNLASRKVLMNAGFEESGMNAEEVTFIRERYSQFVEMKNE